MTTLWRFAWFRIKQYRFGGKVKMETRYRRLWCDGYWYRNLFWKLYWREGGP